MCRNSQGLGGLLRGLAALAAQLEGPEEMIDGEPASELERRLHIERLRRMKNMSETGQVPEIPGFGAS